jgi:hypothetical protein
MQPTWTEFLTACPRSLDEFAKTFNLEKTVDLAPLTDAQIHGFYKDDAQAAEQMIQLRNKCYWANKRFTQPGGVAASINFHKVPVTVDGTRRYHCGRHVGEHRLFGPKVVGCVPGMCGPGYGPQCDGCVLATAHVPVPCPKPGDTNVELAELRARVQRQEQIILERDECLEKTNVIFDEREERIRELKAEVETIKKRSVAEVLVDLLECRIPGSFQEVQRAEYWATILANRCRFRAQEMRDDMLGRAKLIYDYEAAAEGAPSEYICSIGLTLMVDPVIVAETGSTFEREKIEFWFQTHDTDPNMNAVLTSKMLVPNINLRKLIQDYVALQSKERAAKRQRDESWVVEF